MVCELYLTTKSIQISVVGKSELWYTDTFHQQIKLKFLLNDSSLTNVSTQNSA